MVSISNSTFNIRDYLAYVFPGLCIFLLIFFWSPETWESIKQEKIVASVLFLVVSYIFGFSSRTISYFLFVKPYNKIFQNPYKNIFNGEKPVLNKNFCSVFKTKIAEVFGEEIGQSTETNIIYLCFRDIQNTDHKGQNYLSRELTLSNLSASLLLPSFLFFISAIIKLNIPIILFSLVIFISMSRARYTYRRGFAKNVCRIWYTINK